MCVSCAVLDALALACVGCATACVRCSGVLDARNEFTEVEHKFEHEVGVEESENRLVIVDKVIRAPTANTDGPARTQPIASRHAATPTHSSGWPGDFSLLIFHLRRTQSCSRTKLLWVQTHVHAALAHRRRRPPTAYMSRLRHRCAQHETHLSEPSFAYHSAHDWICTHPGPIPACSAAVYTSPAHRRRARVSALADPLFAPVCTRRCATV